MPEATTLSARLARSRTTTWRQLSGSLMRANSVRFTAVWMFALRLSRRRASHSSSSSPRSNSQRLALSKRRRAPPLSPWSLRKTIGQSNSSSNLMISRGKTMQLEKTCKSLARLTHDRAVKIWTSAYSQLHLLKMTKPLT